MKLCLFRHLWGVDGSWETVFPKIKVFGYHGIETSVPAPADRDRFRQLLDQFGFDYIPQIFTTGATVAEHVQSFRDQVSLAQSFHPRFINAHTGRDVWSDAESRQFYQTALKIEADTGTPLAHETHRGRVFYNPWITSRLLNEFDTLKLCCDFSHWVCVCERLLDDQLEIIRQCAGRCLHIHARVGYEEGPQVPDPRAPEYLPYVEAHERWWRMIWDAQAKRGDQISTLTPEFGPPAYLHTLPYTNAPVSDLWEICNWQAKRQAANFATR